MDTNRYTMMRSAMVGFVLCLLPLLACAASMEGMYEARVPVPNESAAVRQAAFRDALEVVLIRLTGERGAASLPSVRQMLNDAGKYVQQFGYNRLTGSGDRPAGLELWARFDGGTIERVVRDAGLPFWGAERPATLMWLAVDDGGQRYLVSSESETDAEEVVRAAARSRGVPVLFPLMDLEDQARVGFADVWGGFLEPVFRASDRYNPQAVLVGRLQRSPSGGWSGRWTLQVGGRDRTWSDAQRRFEGVLREGVETTSDILATLFAVQGSENLSNRVHLTVTDVNSLDQYARVSRYLGSLTQVRHAFVDRVEGNNVDFLLELQGSNQNLEQVIALGGILEPAGTGEPGTYRIRP
jgi:hypothetical protein